MGILSHSAAACLAGALAAGAAPAAELALLAGGATLRIERHEAAGDHVRLFTSADGFVELPASAVRGFEPFPDAAQPDVEAKDEPAPAEPRTLDEAIDELAREFALHPALVRGVVAAESAFDPAAISSKGAIGLMQLMPATARELDVDPYRPEENLLGGVRYLRAMLDRYRAEPDALLRALAAYNAGPGAVDRYGGLPPYGETHAYVRRVLERFLRHSGPALD
jgi:soluble lytic murein transglycosylase-like protein